MRGFTINDGFPVNEGFPVNKSVIFASSINNRAASLHSLNVSLVCLICFKIHDIWLMLHPFDKSGCNLNVKRL